MAQIAPSPAAIAREHTHTNTNERNAFASLPSISITSADSDTHLPLHTPTSTSASTSTHTYTHTRPVTQYDPYIPSDTETSDPIIPSRESSPTTSRGSQSTSRPPGQVTDGDDIGGKGDGSVKTIRAKKRASFPDLIQAASASAPSIVKVDQAGSATAKGGTAEMPVPPASSRLSTDTIRSEDSDTHRRPSMEEILPVGMDMRGALAKCEDPRLGWSLQFWITIVDPVTGHAFYACPATGQTSWTPPTGVFIVPRQVEGEWWELADTTRGNRSYFYNTLTKVTQWTRPGGDAFVVPLGLIQSATLPKREKDNGTSSGEKKEKGTASGQVADNAKSSRQGKTHAPKQDSIQLHQRELKKKRSNQQLRNATSNETIKGTAAQQAEKGQSGGRARAATVSSAAGDSKPLPLTPKGEGEDLPPHMGIQDQSYPSTPTSPFGPRIPLPPDSPSTPTRISTFSFRGIPTPSTPTPKISKLSQSTNSKDIDATRGSSSPQTPQTPESDMTMTPAHRRLRPLSVVGEELSGNEADDSSVSEVEHEHGHGPDKKGKVYGQKGGGGGQESMARRASLFTRRRLSSFGLGGILGKSPEGIPPVPRRGSSLSITSISAPSPIDSTTDLRALGLSPLSPSNSGHSLSTLAAGKGKDDYPYSPILASAKIHIEPTSRPIPIGPMHSSIDLSSSTAFSSSSGHGSSENALPTKRFSTGPHPLLPSLISSDIHAFQLDSFAEQYFAKRRTGIMRTRVPLARLLTWQKTAITAPLLEATGKNYAKEAVIAFKVIQRAMCERDKPVDGARPLRASSVAELETMPSNKMMGLGLGWQMQNLEQQAAGLNGDTGAMGGQQVTPDANVQILEEVRWVIQIAVFAPEMRDEVYAQVVKQLTGNQVLNAMVLGSQLFCVLVNAFSPSIRFEPFVRDFLARHIEQNIKGIGIMALYCQNKLESNRKLSTRARPLTIGEIEHASDAAFYPSIYGDSLDAIMQRQATTFSGPPRNPSHILGHTDVDGASTAGTLNVPVVLPFLARAIIHLGGKQAEGIFRVPGDAEVVAELKSRMDRGHYQLAGLSDPHVAASLYKLFLRELSEPVVPSHMYNEALESSSSPESAIAFLQTLPAAHRRVLVFVIFFTRRFCKEEVVRATKMTPSNLALVLAPNILRTISDSLVTVYTNAAFESKWILTLLQALQKEHLDKADWPEVNF